MKHLFLALSLVLLCLVGSAQTERARISFGQAENPYYKAMQKEYYRVLRHYHIGHNFRGLPWRFFAFDLSDTTNYLSDKSDTLIIIDHHIYYIVTPSFYEKVSIVMIPNNESLYFFSGLNCCKPIHHVSDILEWLSMQYDHVDGAVLERVRNCLSYYQAIPVCPMGSVPQCECTRSNVPLAEKNHHKKPKKRKL
ncbi:MAG: hypothetical protein IKU03_08620 [Bacteroidales bacterium]|nr:hypothetical protein [Bacteroidales bacterium]